MNNYLYQTISTHFEIVEVLFMRFEQLYYFIKIADLHSFSAASNYLFVSQQALSTSIKNLENKFQTTLLTRTPRGVVLTEEGKYFYNIARKMLLLYEDLYNHFVVEPDYQKNTESINITLNKSIKDFYFNKIISYFFKHFPSRKINYLIHKNEEIIDCLIHNEADLGVLPILTINNHIQTDIPEDFNFIPFHKARLALLTNINSPLAHFKSISMSTIVKYPLILNDFSMNGENIYTDIFALFTKNSQIIIADNYPLLIQFIEDNIGHAIIPENNPVPSPQCIKIPITDNIDFSVGFIYKTLPLSEFQKLYIDKSINLIEKEIPS